MSSSVFVEVPRSASAGESGPGVNNDGDSTSLDKADSNLVVIYGKNGMNVDRKALENLIDKKTLTSISVIRITSPTPSMENEEAEEIRKEAAQNQAEEDEKSQSSDSEDDEEENSQSEDEVRTPKITKTRPAILGLTVEEFYPPNEAKELAKEILKFSGVTSLKCNVDYEFQRYVINNDHCYTPFTSPSQVNKVMLATVEEKAKQPTANVRKLPAATSTTVKQYLNKRKQLIEEQQRKLSAEQEKEKVGVSDPDDSSPADNNKTAEEDRDDEGDEDLDDEGSDYTAESEQSAESENDRDSDSDFDVNNRHGRKRKNFVGRRKKKEKQRARSVIMQKALSNKRHLQSQDHITHDEETKSVLAPVKVSKQPQGAWESIKKQLPEEIGAAPSVALVPPLPPAPPAPPVQIQTPTQAAQPRPLINIQSVQIVKPANKIDPSSNIRTNPVTIQPHPATAVVPASPQTVKQIVINKVIASPKGGFTDLSTLIERSDNSPSNLRVSELNPNKQPSVKGFMPLGIDTAAKNQLPAQISIQTHQSSSEIAAENDKQLDLIDSIVKDELQKSFKASEIASASEIKAIKTTQENSIPDLVKMLESTEKAVLEENKMSTTFSSSTVEAIDIANAQLLETPTDDIPEDLLQHVVELMEDKSLQEAVELEVLQQQQQQLQLQEQQQQQEKQESEKQKLENQQQQLVQINKQQTKPASLPLTTTAQPMRQPPQPIVTPTPILLKQPPKSIIEASISNTPTPSSSRDITPPPTLNRSTNVTYLRREPIQIVRGNGRVITLPPIEAPTTRAKRRAQTTLTVSDTSFNDSESCDVSIHSDTSLFADTSHTVERSDPASVSLFTSTPTQPKEKVVKAAGKKKSTAKSIKLSKAKKKGQEEGGSQKEEDEDEDDPNKLWCICRQPHNNRFMICCDVCEDWFHGTCVSITKAMGLEMEQKGVEWTCPKCVKKQEAKTQRKITDLFENKKTPPQLDDPKKSAPPMTVQSKITDVFNKKTIIQLMPKLDDPPAPKPQRLSASLALQNNNITLQEVPGENKHMIDFKKLQPGQFYTVPTHRTPAVKKVQAAKTPEPVQNTFKITEQLTLKKHSPNDAKRLLALASTTPKATAKGGVTKAKATALSQQQLKFTKVPTAAEKKQFIMSKDQLDPLPGRSINQHVKAAVQKPIPTPTPPIEVLPCIVCKRQARPNSIYCSDDCIRKHAQNALNAVKVPEPVNPLTIIKLGPDEKKRKSKGLFEDLLSLADRKPKVERVSVLERRSGKLLTGHNAPTTLNLKKWLQDNPTFEVVQPGSIQALEIEKSKQLPSNLNTFMPLKPDGPIVTSVITLTPPTMPSPQSVLPMPKTTTIKQLDPNKPSTSQASSSPTIVQRSATPKQLIKHTQQLNIKLDKSDRDKDKASLGSPSVPSSSQKVLKKQISTSEREKEKETAASHTPPLRETTESVRSNVRRTLKEQLLIRMKEVSDEKKLSPEKVEEFSKETESEMYRLFNRDIGAKYKAKYRSLMFNIKDRKNETLFLKICGGLIEPKQLVRMSPEELASQELAEWRENEAKHQLEMIKKSELDMLSCAKTYVLKTHKGEEVIEGKQGERVDLDISIPVEDVITVVNDTTVSSTTEVEACSVTPRKDNTFELDSGLLQEAPSAPSSEKKKMPSKERERDREKHHKSKDRHREKTRKRSRSRSRERERDRDRERERHHKSSSRKDERREKEKEKEERRLVKKDEPESAVKAAKDERRDKEERLAKREDPEFMVKTPKVVAAPSKQSVTQTQTSSVNKLIPPIKLVKKSTKVPTAVSSAPPPIETFNLIDQILESTKTVEQAANLQKEKPISAGTSTATTPAQTASKPVAPVDSLPESAANLKSQSPSLSDSDQQPSSTVSISNPPADPYYRYSSDAQASMWKGPINMIDVASFQVCVQTVSGNTYLLSNDLPEELDVVGRISPDTVWDYIGKIKRSPNKEIVVIRLVPTGESETNAYTILYNYLDKRKRLGVIKTTSSNIKDFYIMPLGVGHQMPQVLKPIENFEFYDDEMRPDMLLGIVIRIMGKRSSNSSMRRRRTTTSSFLLSAEEPSKKTTKDSNRSMQATGSSHGMRMSQKPIDDDEMDIDAIIKAPITSKKSSQQQPGASSAVTKDDADEPYSPGGSCSDDEVPAVAIPVRSDDNLKRKMDEINRQIAAQKMEIAGLLGQDQSSSLANISIPSNLHQILASIRSKPEPPPMGSPSGKTPSMVPPPPMIGSLSHHHNIGVGGSNDEEYVPEQPIMHTGMTRDSKPSRLAQLSEAELLSMVPDDIEIKCSDTNTSGTDQPPEKRSRWSEPPPPGMENEYN